jgi:hypothetical protein
MAGPLALHDYGLNMRADGCTQPHQIHTRGKRANVKADVGFTITLSAYLEHMVAKYSTRHIQDTNIVHPG